MLTPENKQFEPWIINNWIDLNDERKTMLYIEVSVPKIAAGTFTSVDLKITDRKDSSKANKVYRFVISVAEAEPEEQETQSDSKSNES